MGKKARDAALARVIIVCLLGLGLWLVSWATGWGSPVEAWERLLSLQASGKDALHAARQHLTLG